jgi:hypothetical protein
VVEPWDGVWLLIAFALWLLCCLAGLSAVRESMARERRPAWTYVVLTIALPPVGLAYASSHDMRARGRTGWPYGFLSFVVWPVGLLVWLIDRRRFPLSTRVAVASDPRSART